MERQGLDQASVWELLTRFYFHWEDLVYIILVLFCTLIVTLVIHFLLGKHYKWADATKHVWRDAIVGALSAPAQLIVWVIGISVVERVLAVGGHAPFLVDVFPPVRDVVAITLVAWFLVRLTRRAADNLYNRAKRQNTEFDQTAADAIGKMVIAIIVIAAALVVMQTLGFSIASLLAFGGVAGIALGFAAQGLVSNLLGGITIYASRPFKVGDHVVFSGASLMGNAGYIGWQAGEVKHIGWRATHILDWNGKPFYVPNSKFNTETIINHSRMSYRELSEYVYVRLEDIDRISGITEDVNRMLKEHPDMGDYLVFKFDGYGDYALRLYLYAYTVSRVTAYTEFMRVKQEIMLGIAKIIKQRGAKLAVPVSTVYLPDGRALQRDNRPDGLVEERGAEGVSDQR